MSTLWDGIDDQMVYGSVTGIDLTGAHSLLVVAKFASASGWASLLETENSAAGTESTMGRDPNDSNTLYFSNGAGLRFVSTIALTDTSNWMVLGGSRAAGTSTPRGHRCVIGGANTHGDMNSTLSATGSVSGGTIRIGGNDDFANIRVAAAAIFAANLSDANYESVASAKTTQSIADLNPVWLVDDSDGFATDLTAGTVNRTAITGTASDADNPSGWVYGLGGAVLLPFLVMAPPMAA